MQELASYLAAVAQGVTNLPGIVSFIIQLNHPFHCELSLAQSSSVSVIQFCALSLPPCKWATQHFISKDLLNLDFTLSLVPVFSFFPGNTYLNSSSHHKHLKKRPSPTSKIFSWGTGLEKDDFLYHSQQKRFESHHLLLIFSLGQMTSCPWPKKTLRHYAWIIQPHTFHHTHLETLIWRICACM